jgi:hypothetical protein
MRCRCGLRTGRQFCAYERRTIELIKSRRCVACGAPVFDVDTVRVEGRCAECRGRNVRLSPSTKYLLHLAAVSRYRKVAA